MKRCRLLLVLLLLLPLGGLLLVPSVRWPVYSWLRGEAFYQGMPASWWAEEIDANYIELPSIEFDAGIPAMWAKLTPSSVYHKLGQRLLPAIMSLDGAGEIVEVPLLPVDPDALPVLLALLRNQSAKVRRVAIS